MPENMNQAQALSLVLLHEAAMASAKNAKDTKQAKKYKQAVYYSQLSSPKY